MALTSGSVTIKLAGGDYTTWAAFWDDIGNLTGNITCTVDASAFTEGAAPGAVGESLNGNTLHVLPATFPSATDASDGARFTCNYVGRILDMEMEGAGAVTLEGIVFIEGTSEPTAAVYATVIATSFDFIVKKCIVKGCTYGFYEADVTLDAGVQWYNNIIYDCSQQGIVTQFGAPNGIIANNTVNNCVSTGVNLSSNNAVLENNLCWGNGFADFFGNASATGNNNADEDDTCEDADWNVGANNVPGIADPFNAIGSDDFTITVEGSIGSAGKDLSGSFTDDFFGVTRNNWTIGACEWEVNYELITSTTNSVITATMAITLGKVELITATSNSVITATLNLPVIFIITATSDSVITAILNLPIIFVVTSTTNSVITAALNLPVTFVVTATSDSVIMTTLTIILRKSVTATSNSVITATMVITLGIIELGVAITVSIIASAMILGVTYIISTTTESEVSSRAYLSITGEEGQENMVMRY